MRVVQPVGELSHDPRGRALVAQRAQGRQRGRALLPDGITRLAAGPPAASPSATLFVFSANVDGPRGLDRLQGVHQLLAGDRSRRIGPELGQNGREARPAQVGHADGPQARALILVERIDRDDVGVQQLGERLGLVPFDGRDLQHDGAAGQVGLLRQEHPGERPLPEGRRRRKPKTSSPTSGKRRENPVPSLSPVHRAEDGFLREEPFECLASAREIAARIPPG